MTTAVLGAHAGAVVKDCKQEKEDGRILLTEEDVELTAFAARFPGAKATKAEKQTASDGKVTYELAFGALVDEERGQD